MENFELITTAIRILAGIGLGLLTGLFYMYKSTYSKSFVIMLALLPAIVGTVIGVVNGDVGTGVAVMGAFSLVRFRSIPGTAKEIGFIFFAMAIGLATGMGYILYALVFTLLVGLMSVILFASSFGEQKQVTKRLKITMPENLDYAGIFDDLFQEYTKSNTLKSVKTTNMGSLFQLQYEIILKNEDIEKEFIDKIRVRNGNLDIICSHIDTIDGVL